MERMRRKIGLGAIAFVTVVALAALVAPAAQAAPPPEITAFSPGCGPLGAAWP